MGFVEQNVFALMPVFPLMGWVLLIAFGKRFKEPTPGYIAAGMVFVSFVIAVVGFFQVRGLHEGQQLLDTVRWNWLPYLGGEGKPLAFGFALDQLSSVMTLVITGVGFLIHLFAIGYMHGDAGFSRFFAYLNFFVALMLVLVLGDNLPVIFIGWEGVGVASFLLIGFWYTSKENADAARKAFIVNRVGDLFFMLGMFLIFKTFGTLNIHEIGEAFGRTNIDLVGEVSRNTVAYGAPVLELACVFLLLGAAGKSAQLPLSAWLPDAMAGPTPVSALIHAATMVTAGVYLVARMGHLYANAPLASGWVAWVGALTALYGALSAVAQTDIKKILAYSTVSQLGYMFIAVGTGAYWAGVFHVVTHAFFKALLFLASGSVIHACDGEQDVRQMGGLKSKLPTTHMVSLVGTLAISGIPIFAGFWSKDAILTAAFSTPFGGGEGGGYALWGIGLVVAILTAMYMWRWYILVFLGDYRGRAHPHESPAIMTTPLWILAGLSVVGGFVGLPHFLGKNVNLLEHFLEPVTQNAEGFGKLNLVPELILIGVAILAAVLGIVMANFWYKRAGWQGLANVAGGFGNASRKALFLDDAYNIAFSAPSKALSETLEYADRHGVDRAALGLANGLGETSVVLKDGQSGFVRAYAALLLLGTVVLLGFLVVRGLL